MEVGRKLLNAGNKHLEILSMLMNLAVFYPFEKESNTAGFI